MRGLWPSCTDNHETRGRRNRLPSSHVCAGTACTSCPKYLALEDSAFAVCRGVIVSCDIHFQIDFAIDWYSLRPEPRNSSLNSLNLNPGTQPHNLNQNLR